MRRKLGQRQDGRRLLSPPPPRSIRLVALDIDGTLLTPEGHVSPRTARAIRAALDRGVLVLLCTGRIYSEGVRQLGEELGLSLPAIVRNGTAIQDLQTGAVLDRQPIPPGTLERGLDVLLPLGLSPVVEEGPGREDRLFTGPEPDCHPAVFHFARLWKRFGHLRHLPTARDLYRVEDPNWLGACGTRDTTRAAAGALQQLPGVEVRWYGDGLGADDPHCTDVSPAGCSKASALARFADQHAVALSEAFAIGDFFNDVEMLQEVGWGVAMGHAPDAVKQAADAVTLDNAHDGCAVAIERYVLGWDTKDSRGAG
ncbi:MAG TPA: Cof-type HAD-IIB family hydrolase [Chloroflexota bacterium]|nr:Cof-type HAD-IIB family hydrolase [Chloroflexota bacterium]